MTDQQTNQSDDRDESDLMRDLPDEQLYDLEKTISDSDKESPDLD